jgi:hypothetical protein
MLHLVISCSSYLLFFVVKALMPIQPASWRIAEQTHPNRFVR